MTVREVPFRSVKYWFFETRAIRRIVLNASRKGMITERDDDTLHDLNGLIDESVT